MLCCRWYWLLVLWVDCHHGLVFCKENHCVLFSAGTVVGLRCWGRSLLFFVSFMLLYVYSRLLTTILMVYNLCYEGSLIADL
jgi:hypothetical protein